MGGLALCSEPFYTVSRFMALISRSYRTAVSLRSASRLSRASTQMKAAPGQCGEGEDLVPRATAPLDGCAPCNAVRNSRTSRVTRRSLWVADFWTTMFGDAAGPIRSSLHFLPTAGGLAPQRCLFVALRSLLIKSVAGEDDAEKKALTRIRPRLWGCGCALRSVRATGGPAG